MSKSTSSKVFRLRATSAKESVGAHATAWGKWLHHRLPRLIYWYAVAINYRILIHRYTWIYDVICLFITFGHWYFNLFGRKFLTPSLLFAGKSLNCERPSGTTSKTREEPWKYDKPEADIHRYTSANRYSNHFRVMIHGSTNVFYISHQHPSFFPAFCRHSGTSHPAVIQPAARSADETKEQKPSHGKPDDRKSRNMKITQFSFWIVLNIQPRFWHQQKQTTHHLAVDELCPACRCHTWFISLIPIIQHVLKNCPVWSSEQMRPKTMGPTATKKPPRPLPFSMGGKKPWGESGQILVSPKYMTWKCNILFFM